MRDEAADFAADVRRHVQESRLPPCGFVAPVGFDRRTRQVVRGAIRAAGFRCVEVLLDARPEPFENALRDLALVPVVVAADSTKDAAVSGVAVDTAARGAALILLEQRGGLSERLRGDRLLKALAYDVGFDGELALTEVLRLRLQRLRAELGLGEAQSQVSNPSPVDIDWDKLEQADFENLCRELLMQMGFQDVEWTRGRRDFDLVAEWSRKDPDGSEFQELWLVSLGGNARPETLLDELTFKPERIIRYLVQEHRISARFRDLEFGSRVAALFMLPSREHVGFDIERFRDRQDRRVFDSGLAPIFQVHIWDRIRLTSLVQGYPQLAYKYFSDEARAQSKFRKTPEQLYSENVDLAERQAILITQLEDEKNKRIRAERDAAWKDISFSAAHKMGNPVFAIETNLDPLSRRIAEQRTAEAQAVVASIRTSVEKAKRIVDQFKSLTRAQEIHPVRVALKPLLEDACQPAGNRGVACEIHCEEGLEVLADPERLAECFDELVSNSLHWLDKPEKKIEISVTRPTANLIPSDLDTAQKYALIEFRDNGPGVPIENKQRIFDAFFTTYEHGTGLGLALVRRIVEGHGGTIWERGIPGAGAEFELYLPLPKANGNGNHIAQQPDLPFDGEGE